MCNCRKCGAKAVTRRSAGVFFCQRCGMQPGQSGFDRTGIQQQAPQAAQEADAAGYIVKSRTPALRGHIAT